MSAGADWLEPPMRAAIEAMSEAQRFAVVLYGEARSEPIEGLLAVASVIRNRVTAGRFGKDYGAVATAPYQFSCLFPRGGGGNYKRVLAFAQQFVDKQPITDPVALKCIAMAECVMRNYFPDNTRGSTHYCVYTLSPDWAKGKKPAVRLGTHHFFNDVQ